MKPRRPKAGAGLDPGGAPARPARASGTAAEGLGLDPLAVPLAGSRLIEASAGTGKTWTIAALFVRLVLGHGGARPLAPGEILVMTFTIAATRELAGRIRERLAEAAACFGGTASPKGDDEFLPRLMAAYPEGAAREAAAWRLARAADAMDDAAVTTIDAWCQRMLREHAFTSGSLFDETLMPDETALLAEAARDVWRREVYPLGDAAFALVRGRWKDAAALAGDVTPLVWRTLPPGAGAAPLAEVVDALIAERVAALAALKAGWAASAARLGQWFEGLWARRDCPLDRRRPVPANARRWLGALAAWADDPAAERLDLGAGRARLTPAGVRDGIKPGHVLELPGEFAAFEALMQALDELPSAGAMLRLHAAARVAVRMQELKRARGTFGFADLLARLDDALDAARHGDKARRLRDTILAQFPAALIDEFQDTSPVQLSVFDRVYGIAGNDPSRLLLLIGDPKQAIYAFRGADIYSYLRARRATAGRHHALATNRRSTAALVHAVNTLFERAEARPGDGAFGFGGPSADAAATGGDRLPYARVEAHGRGERLVTSEGPLPAMTLALDAGPPAGNVEIRERFAALSAERIAALLADRGARFEPHGDGPSAAAAAGSQATAGAAGSQATAGAAGAQLALPFEGEAEPLPPPPAPPAPLQPRDIAVLVRTGVEAAAVRRALMRHGIASVYLSDSESVFASAEAVDLLRLLEAVAEPRRAALVRAALATSLVDAPLAELARLADDDVAFATAAERFVRLHAVWREQGVLAMLRRALHVFDLPARWLARPGGERRITNVMHLAELLQAAAAEARGEQALVRWLAGELDAPRGGTQPDEQIVRLESDADLVRVITVHKAKGLEYPVVLLPFPVLFREGGGDAADGVLMPDAGGGAAQWVARPDADQREWLDRERLREDLRLLYVALTRARHALWVGLAPLQAGRGGKGGDCAWHRSAIGTLLSGAAPRTIDELTSDVSAFAAAAGHDVAVELVETDGVGEDVGDDEVEAISVGSGRLRTTRRAWPAPADVPAPPVPSALPAAPPYAATFDRRWSVASYTALVQQGRGASGSQARAGLAGAPAADPALAAADSPLDSTLAPASTVSSVSSAWPLRDDDDDSEADGSPSPRAGAGEPWHRFPRGALAGNFLHGVLEGLQGDGFALEGRADLRAALVRRCERQGRGGHAEDVLAWMAGLATAPLPALGAALADVRTTVAELEFWFPVTGMNSARLDAACREHLLPGAARTALTERTLHGLMMGFADLVIEHAGRWWVLDYKSNALGARDADYHPAALAEAVLGHRYDLQAALYQLALHRLLKARLGARYAPGRHLGGALVWFIRGWRAEGTGCLALPATPALIDALDAALPVRAVDADAEGLR